MLLRNQLSTFPEKCRHCQTFYSSLEYLKKHVANKHDIVTLSPQKRSTGDPIVPTEHQHAIHKFFQSFRVTLERDESNDLWIYMEANKNRIIAFLNDCIKPTGPLKVMFSMAIKLVQPVKNGQITMYASSFTRPFTLFVD